MARTENSKAIDIERLDVVDSTSAHVRRLIGSGGFGDGPRLFVASEQTGGVGRFGRAWASPVGGLWVTLGWPFAASVPRVLDGLGLRVGLALLHSIDHALAAHGHDSDVRIKWPNDILIRGRKVAGVLCETMTAGATTHVLVGVGINGNFPVASLPQELHATATTLMDEVGSRVNLDRLLDDLVARLTEALTTHGITEHRIAAIERRMYGVGDAYTVTLPNLKQLTGTLLGLTTDGRLRLQTEDGEVVLPSGAELAVGR
jgi:BirA family biotin operon repressor/biotin-[acetyl-CoA-carboxylase] ligase